MTTIISYLNNDRVAKSQITALYTGADVKYADGMDKFEWGKTNGSEQFKKDFPMCKVPAANTPDGPLFESNAIARYMARTGDASMYGSNAYEASCIDQWLDFSALYIEAVRVGWAYPVLGFMPYNKGVYQQSKKDVAKAMGVLNSFLESRTYLVGDKISLADVVVACSLKLMYSMFMDPAFIKPFVNTNRWYTTVMNQPNFVKVLGEVKFAESEKKYVAPKKEKKQKKNKEPAAAPAKKWVDPLKGAPKAAVNLDEWKRIYSNSDEADSCKWFFEKLDEFKKDYSFYLATYKYNEENTKVFMTANLVNGFHQRVDRARKHAFASATITEEGKIIILKSFWIMRKAEGVADPLPHVTMCDDFELYDWAPIDPAEKKEFVTQMLSWTEPNHADGAVFK